MRKTFFNIFIVIAVTGILSTGCNKDNGRVIGSGPIVSQEFNMSEITGVQLSIDGNVYLTEGDTQLVRIEAQQNIIDNIRKSVSAGHWDIGFLKDVAEHDNINIYITTSMLELASISGSGNIECQGSFTDSTNVSLGISGSGNIVMGLLADRIISTISGSGNIILTGEANEHAVTISGSGNMNAFGLKTLRTDVTISGTGNCQVFATEDLNVIISGSGNVYYKGYPSIDVTISGSGSLINSN